MAIDDNTSYELTGAQVKDLASKIKAKADSSSLATVATSGSYADLSNKPTIPTVNDGTLTIQQNGTTVGTFTANQSSAATVSLTDTTYSAMTGATSSTAGASGLVPAPAAGDEAKVLSGAGTWVSQTGGSTYTAGNGINISANDEISIDTSVVAELSDLPTVNDGTLTIQHNGTTKGTFTANQSTASTVNIETIYADTPGTATTPAASVQASDIVWSTMPCGAVKNVTVTFKTGSTTTGTGTAKMLKLSNDGLVMITYNGSTGYGDAGTGERQIEWVFSGITLSSVIGGSVNSWYSGNINASMTYSALFLTGGECYVVKSTSTNQTRQIRFVIYGYLSS